MNLKSSFCILVFTLSLCTLACSSTDIQPQEISKQEFDEAFKQYQTYNLIADTNAVDSATRVRMTHEIKQLYGKWKEHINIFQVGKIHETKEYMAIVVGVTGEFFINLFDKSMRLIPIDSASYNRLPMEYHAYSKAGLWAGEDWWECRRASVEYTCTETRDRQTENHLHCQGFNALFSSCLGSKKH